MKKIIILFITALGLWTTVTAQCTVSSLAVQLKSVTTIGNDCIANFDLSWQQEINSGNKFAVLHLWRTDQYPALEANGMAYSPTSNHPDETDLVLALATIIIEDNGTANPFIGTTYYPHPAVPVLSSGLSIDKEMIDVNWERMTIKNISLTINDCSGTSITGDIWASQANNSQNVHCVSSGISMVIGNPLVTGNLYCIIPHQYDMAVTNKGTAGINLTYNVYIDEGDAIYEPIAHDLKITSVPQGPFIVAPGETYNSGMQSYLPWSETKPYADHGLWIEVNAVGIPNKAIFFIPNPCRPLAINYTSLAAIREHKEVKLMWQTSAEANNYGFEIQRRTGSATFQTIAFVPSKALNGNSTSAIFYSYTDLNAERYITEYRLKQIDLDKKFTLSQVVAVRGDEQSTGHVIYPNPAINNTVKLVFKDWNAWYDIDLIDVSGRVVKTYQNINTQSLEINKIPQGVYILRIFDKSTRDMTSERVLVY